MGAGARDLAVTRKPVGGIPRCCRSSRVVPDAMTKLGGTFTIGGDLVVHRLGFRAMGLTGPGIWGPPPDIDEGRRGLARGRELRIDFMGTAYSYRPYLDEGPIGLDCCE